MLILRLQCRSNIPEINLGRKYLPIPRLPFGKRKKMIKAPISYLRRLGLRMVIDSEDILVLNKTRENAVLAGIKVGKILESPGFMMNVKK